MTECFVGAYAGWSVQTWLITILASALIPTMVSIPFWMRRDADWGVMAVVCFAAFMAVHGLAGCLTAVPGWVFTVMSVVVLGLVAAAYLMVLQPKMRCVR